jgi:hypothetical protein
LSVICLNVTENALCELSEIFQKAQGLASNHNHRAPFVMKAVEPTIYVNELNDVGRVSQYLVGENVMYADEYRAVRQFSPSNSHM